MARLPIPPFFALTPTQLPLPLLPTAMPTPAPTPLPAPMPMPTPNPLPPPQAHKRAVTRIFLAVHHCPGGLDGRAPRGVA